MLLQIPNIQEKNPMNMLQPKKLQNMPEPIQALWKELSDDQSTQLLGGATVQRGSGLGPVFTNRKKRKVYLA